MPLSAPLKKFEVRETFMELFFLVVSLELLSLFEVGFIILKYIIIKYILVIILEK